MVAAGGSVVGAEMARLLRWWGRIGVVDLIVVEASAWPALNPCHPAPLRENMRMLRLTTLLLLSSLTGCATTSNQSVPPPACPSTKPATIASAPWRSLFNGKDLAGWKPSGFAGQNDPEVKDACLILPFGERLAGVTYDSKEALPTNNYEISLEAKRIQGTDFFCGLTFPVDKSFASLIIGGWGGGVTGISNIDDYDAANNDTTKVHKFESGRWYAIRLRSHAQETAGMD